MPILSPEIAAAWRTSRYSPLFWTVNTAYNLWVGLALLLGDPSRVSSASFISIRQYGGPTAWGAVLLLAGVGIAAGPFISSRALSIALGGAGMAYLLLAAGFIVAARSSPEAALTGPPTYLFIAAAHGLHAGHYFRASRN